MIYSWGQINECKEQVRRSNKSGISSGVCVSVHVCVHGWKQRWTYSQPYLVLVKVKVAQLCPTLFDPTDYTVHGIVEWVAFPIFRGSFQPRDRTQASHIAGGFFTACWAMREAPWCWQWQQKWWINRGWRDSDKWKEGRSGQMETRVQLLFSFPASAGRAPLS